MVLFHVSLRGGATTTLAPGAHLPDLPSKSRAVPGSAGEQSQISLKDVITGYLRLPRPAPQISQ